MKKLLVLFFAIFSSCYYVCAEPQMWVDNFNAANGHVTYTSNVWLPSKDGMILIKARKDYACSQNTYAVLWLEGYNNEDLSKPIDITFMVDKNKLRKYTPADPGDYAVNIVRQYCEN